MVAVSRTTSVKAGRTRMRRDIDALPISLSTSGLRLGMDRLHVLLHRQFQSPPSVDEMLGWVIDACRLGAKGGRQRVVPQPSLPTIPLRAALKNTTTSLS
jgi:hypothetical protein